MKYTLAIKGSVALAVERPDAPVTYEIMFDHMQIEADGLEPQHIVDALTKAFSTAIIGGRKSLDAVEAAYPWEADEFAGRQAMALLAASVALTDGDVAKAGEALISGHLRLDLNAAQVQYVSGYLHSHGVVPDWATARADIEGVEIPEEFR